MRSQEMTSVEILSAKLQQFEKYEDYEAWLTQKIVTIQRPFYMFAYYNSSLNEYGYNYFQSIQKDTLKLSYISRLSQALDELKMNQQSNKKLILRLNSFINTLKEIRLEKISSRERIPQRTSIISSPNFHPVFPNRNEEQTLDESQMPKIYQNFKKVLQIFSAFFLMLAAIITLLAFLIDLNSTAGKISIGVIFFIALIAFIIIMKFQCSFSSKKKTDKATSKQETDKNTFDLTQSNELKQSIMEIS